MLFFYVSVLGARLIWEIFCDKFPLPLQPTFLPWEDEKNPPLTEENSQGRRNSGGKNPWYYTLHYVKASNKSFDKILRRGREYKKLQSFFKIAFFFCSSLFLAGRCCHSLQVFAIIVIDSLGCRMFFQGTAWQNCASFFFNCTGAFVDILSLLYICPARLENGH